MSSIEGKRTVKGSAQTVVNDMPGGLQEQSRDLRLPKGWVQVIYGIPETSAGLRDRLRKVVKAHGLLSIDLGGSVYMGVRNAELDQALNEMIAKIENETGMRDLIRLVPGSYDELEAAFFKDRITANTLVDVEEAERSIQEFKLALAGDITLVDKNGKPRDLLGLGESRFRSAKAAIEAADAVLGRFSGNPALEQEAERIRMRLEQVRAWTESVEKGYRKWAESERKKGGRRSRRPRRRQKRVRNNDPRRPGQAAGSPSQRGS